MSTIIAVKKNGRACLAADTLVTWGGTKQTGTYLADLSKIVKIGDTYLGITGVSVHLQVIENYFANCESYSFDTPQDIFETWRQFHKALKDEYFWAAGDEKELPYEQSHMHVLLANPRGIFGVYSLRSVDAYNKFWAFGSGTEYALGALYGAYDRYENVEDIARAGIEAAAEFDNGSALPMTIHTVELVK